AAERPQHDLVRPSANLTASEGVSELVNHHNQEQRQILQHVPGDRGVISFSSLDFICSDKKPRPMDKHVNSVEAEQADRALASAGHVGSLLHNPERRYGTRTPRALPFLTKETRNGASGLRCRA